MSEENVEIVRRLLAITRDADLAEAWNAAAELLHPEIAMDTTRAPIPGLAGIYKGPDEVARFWLGWVEAWGTLGRFEDPEVIDAGDRVFQWFTQHEVQGRGSGVEVKMPEYGWVLTVRDQKVVRATIYMDRAEALEAAGLSGWAMSQENVEIVRRLNAAFAGTDPQPPSDFLAADAVWDMSTYEKWPDRIEYRGPDEYAMFIDAWVAPYDEWTYEVEELIDAGETEVVAKLYQRGKPRGSAGWIDQRYGIVYTIEHGLVQRAEVYATVDEALEAAGLSE